MPPPRVTELVIPRDGGRSISDTGLARSRQRDWRQAQSCCFRAGRSRVQRGGLLMDYRRQLDLDGEIAIVTGGARGIGFESAKALGSCGAHVVLLDLDQAALDAAAASLAEAGITGVSTRQLDVTDPSAVEATATD